MEKKISAVEARRGLGQLLEEVYYRGDQVLLERAGRVMAVVIPPQVYEQWKRQRQEDFRIFQEVRDRNPGADPGQVEEDVQKAVGEVRGKKRRSKKQR